MYVSTFLKSKYEIISYNSLKIMVLSKVLNVKKGEFPSCAL